MRVCTNGTNLDDNNRTYTLKGIWQADKRGVKANSQSATLMNSREPKHRPNIPTLLLLHTLLYNSHLSIEQFCSISDQTDADW
jgi:hypothetical protein